MNRDRPYRILIGGGGTGGHVFPAIAIADALKEREENFRALIDNSLDISVITNADQTIRYVNPSVERILGYKPEEIIGKSPFDLMPPEEAERILKVFKEISNKKAPLERKR